MSTADNIVTPFKEFRDEFLQDIAIDGFEISCLLQQWATGESRCQLDDELVKESKEYLSKFEDGSSDVRSKVHSVWHIISGLTCLIHRDKRDKIRLQWHKELKLPAIRAPPTKSPRASPTHSESKVLSSRATSHTAEIAINSSNTPTRSRKTKKLSTVIVPAGDDRPHKRTKFQDINMEQDSMSVVSSNSRRPSNGMPEMVSMSKPEATGEATDLDMPVREPIRRLGPSQLRSRKASRETSASIFESVSDVHAFAPWTLVQDVVTVFTDPLPRPKDTGTIYAIQAKHSPKYVKIGYTMGPLKDRMAEIGRECQIEVELGTKFSRSDIPYTKLRRLEKVLHTDLAFFHRNLYVPRDGGHKISEEWFEIEMSTAIRAIKFWKQAVNIIEAQRGTKHEQTMRRQISEMPEFCDLERSRREKWVEINLDHNSRMRAWAKVFGIDLEELEQDETDKSKSQVSFWDPDTWDRSTRISVMLVLGSVFLVLWLNGILVYLLVVGAIVAVQRYWHELRARYEV